MEIRTARDIVKTIKEIIIINKHTDGNVSVIVKNIDANEFEEKSNKFVEFLTDNAESENFELLEMDMADENGQEYIELCMEALHKYKYLTQAINDIDKSDESVQKTDIDHLNARIKKAINLLTKQTSSEMPSPPLLQVQQVWLTQPLDKDKWGTSSFTNKFTGFVRY